MRGLRDTLTLTRYSLLATLRTPRAVIFTLIFPVLILVILNSLYSSNSSADSQTVSGFTVTTTAYLTAGMVAYATALTGFTQTVTSITFQREAGQLKRLRGTPASPWTVVAAQAIRVTVQVVLIVALMIGLSALLYDLHLDAGALAAVALYAVLGGLTFTALGIAVAGTTTSADSAGPISAAPVVLLAFISGIWIPVSQLGETMQKVGDFFPLAHLAQGMQVALGLGAHGIELNWGDVRALLIWIAVAGLIAARRFEWEPRGL